jgi:hypothetical protein
MGENAMEAHNEDHGHSVAAWTAVGIMLVGAAVGSVAVVIPSLVLGIIAAVVIVVGAIVGKVLAMAGYGSKPHDREGEDFLADAPDERGTSTVGKS